MKVLMIIPAYNEEKNIVDVVSKITNYKKIDLDYIVINDGSKDNTKQTLINNNINFIDLVNNLGIGAAIQTGYKYALENDYDIAIQFDGDGQHDINYVDRLIEPIIKGEANMVIGSRFVGNESEFKSGKIRRIGITYLSLLLKIFTGKSIKDMTSGFRAVDKSLIKYFSNSYPSEYPESITNVLLLKHKYILKEVPVRMFERKHGKSSITFAKTFYYGINVSIAILIFGLIRYKGVRK